jgi:predicted hydrolase (HD superfamily)
MITREEAFNLIQKYLKNKENIQYAISLEFLLREMAKRLNKNENIWGLTGLLQNIDYEYSEKSPEIRGNLSSQILDGLLPNQCLDAIKSSNYPYTNHIPATILDKSLLAAVSLMELIVKTAENTPSKKISDIDLKTIIDKFNDKKFAPNIKRSKIELCGDIGIELEAFFKLSLETLKSISDQIGL